MIKWQSDFLVKGESWHYATKNKMQAGMFFKGAISHHKSHLWISLSLDGNYEL